MKTAFLILAVIGVISCGYLRSEIRSLQDSGKQFYKADIKHIYHPQEGQNWEDVTPEPTPLDPRSYPAPDNSEYWTYEGDWRSGEDVDFIDTNEDGIDDRDDLDENGVDDYLETDEDEPFYDPAHKN